MGVPGLFPWVQENFRRFVEIIHLSQLNKLSPTVNNKSVRKTTDNLYVDGNALLHPAAQKVYNYGQGKSLMNPYTSLSDEKKLEKVFDLFFQSIIDLMKIVRPKRLLYIAIDGPAPLAKQAQQRQRRFGVIPENDPETNGARATRRFGIVPENDPETILEKDETIQPSKISRKSERFSEAPSSELHGNFPRKEHETVSRKTERKSFDPTSITPGTTFMLELTRYMNATIRMHMEDETSMFHNIEVIFSPPNVPGEGEHKIMDYIRGIPEPSRWELDHCMCGPDGDLIMLTMAIRSTRMTLLREDQQNAGNYYLLDMGSIYATLPDNLIPNHRSPVRELHSRVTMRERKDRSLDDFLLLGFFIGNDFLPRIEMFQHLNRGLDMMMSIYRTKIYHPLTFMEGGRVHLSTVEFQKFIGLLVSVEKSELTKNARCVPKDKRMINKTLRKNIKNTVLDMRGYRRDFYAKSGITLRPENPVKSGPIVGGQSGEELIKKMCHDYIKTLCWVLQYYTTGLPSWSWYYPWHYAPLMQDLYTYLDSINAQKGLPVSEDVCEFKLGQASDPFLQLLTVVPKTSSHLLPPPYRVLYDEKPLESFQNIDFESLIDFEGKTKAHMAVVKLDFVDVTSLREKYETIKKGVRGIYARNEPGLDSLFIYDKGYEASFESKYWSSDRVHVKKYYI